MRHATVTVTIGQFAIMLPDPSDSLTSCPVPSIGNTHASWVKCVYAVPIQCGVLSGAVQYCHRRLPRLVAAVHLNCVMNAEVLRALSSIVLAPCVACNFRNNRSLLSNIPVRLSLLSHSTRLRAFGLLPALWLKSLALTNPRCTYSYSSVTDIRRSDKRHCRSMRSPKQQLNLVPGQERHLNRDVNL